MAHKRPDRTPSSHAVVQLLERLPSEFRVSEDADFVYIRCRQCNWVAVFSAAGATLKEMISESKLHHCRMSQSASE
jgi:hypothetical protein